MVVRENSEHHLRSQNESTMSMVQAKGRDHPKQVLHQKGWSDPPGVIESFRFQAEDDYENQIFSILG